MGLGIGDLAVLFEDSKRDDEHSPTFAAQLGGQIRLDRVTLLNVGLDHSTEYTTAEEDGALVTETELVTSIVRSLSPVSALVAGVGLSRSDSSTRRARTTT